ncbi:TetR/AcrR family transcriptional regulator [Microbacterium sp. RD1]|uniref:TetR/AcrR family transcriptional regulator n=1 Tax=Microbacterium sp. RD1 TaxID=3457313 RepID=UPI003FA57779
MAPTWRAIQKANRRESILRAAARLFAARGFAAVSTVEIGEAVGMSGPALYNYFPSKEALLAAVLVEASTRLLDGCREIVAPGRPAGETLDDLISFHLDFATSDPDIIRIQDRELAQLPVDVNHQVRELQRRYVQEWDHIFAQVRADMPESERQTRLLAVFGLLNSTPYSAVPTGHGARAILQAMAVDALLGAADVRVS